MALARARAQTWLDREPDPTLIQISNPDRRKGKKEGREKIMVVQRNKRRIVC